MYNNSKKILPEIKAQILREAQAPNCIVSKLAKSYNISKTTIYTWKQGAKEFTTSSKNETDKTKRFVELSVLDNKSSILEKASLIFNDFSLVIEGKVKSASLLAILRILEEQSC
jgi:transposase-like protein